MIQITWHLIVFIVTIIGLVGGAYYSHFNDNTPDYGINLTPGLLILLAIVVAIIYGGIVWW